MPFLRFADNAAMYDSTPLDNMFIIENLPSAPEAFLKVYIYARMLCMHPEMGGIEELSRALRLDGEMIENAFAYWERMGFMRRVADNPPEYVFVPTRGSTVTEMDRDYYKYRDFNGDLQGLFPAGKLIHPAQYGLANDWLNVYGFEQGAVIALVKNAIANSRSKNPDPARVFKTVDKKVQELAKLDITDEAGVVRFISKDAKVDSCAKEVLRSLGMFRTPTDAETEMAAKWLHDWKFSEAEILDACRDTVKGHNPSFAYLDRILENRRASAGDESFEVLKHLFGIMGVSANPNMVQREWYNGLIKEGFEKETVELAARQQAKKTYPNYEGLKHMLDKWRTKGLFGFEAANEYVTRSEELFNEFKAILFNAGIEKRPNEDELVNYDLWRQTTNHELMQYAANKSKGNTYAIRHMWVLLQKWQDLGITDVEGAKNAEAKIAAGRQQAQQPKVNPALKYEQRDYNDDDFDGDAFMEAARRMMEQQGAGSEGN